MQKRSRRAHGIKSTKVSVSVSEEDLKILSSRAKRVHGGNVSAVVHEMIDVIRRLDAADALLAMLGGDRVSDQDLQTVRDEVAATPKRRSKRRSAA